MLGPALGAELVTLEVETAEPGTEVEPATDDTGETAVVTGTELATEETVDDANAEMDKVVGATEELDEPSSDAFAYKFNLFPPPQNSVALPLQS